MSARLDDYELLEELGAGGMGAVYRAREKATDTIVALKVLRVPATQRAEAEARFAREVELGSRIEHPGVVRTRAAGSGMLAGEDVQFLVMPFVPGQSLRQLLDDAGAQGESVSRHIGLHVAGALEALHAAGIVHRDVKPENVLLTPEGRVVLADLGVARALGEGSDVSVTGQFVGSIAYAPPEAFDEAYVSSTSLDVWALGVLLFELVTGVHPFERGSAEATIRAILHERPRRFRDHGAQDAPFLEALTRRLLEPQAGERPQDGAAVVALFEGGEEATWWRSDAEASDPQTPWLEQLDVQTPLVGRDEPLRALQGVVGAPGEVIVLRGLPGSGRTRLAHEALAARTDLGVIYASGASVRAARWLADGLRDLVPNDERAAYLEAVTQDDVLASDVGRHLDDAARPFSASFSRALFDEVVLDALGRCATQQALVLWFDDAEAASADVRRQLVAAIRAAKRLGLCIWVTLAEGTMPGDLAAVLEQHATNTIDLEPLSERALWTWVRSRYGADHISDDVAPVLDARTGGSPAVVQSFLARLDSEGYIRRQPEGGWSITSTRKQLESLPMAETAEGVWRSRVLGLDTQDRELLDVAACLGRAFEPRVLAQVLGSSTLDVLRRLTRLARGAKLVRSVRDAFEFAATPVRRVVLDETPPALQTAYHGALAEALTSLAPDDPAAICEQWLAARDPAAALPFAMSAIDALDRSGRASQGMHIVRTLLDAERSLDVREIARVAYRGLTMGMQEGDLLDVDVIAPWLEEARRAEEASSIAYLELAIGHRHMRGGDIEAAAESMARAVESARGGDDWRAHATTCEAYSQMCVYLGKHELGIALAEEALERSDGRTEQEAQLAVNYITRSAHWSSLDRFDKSLPLIEMAVENAREQGFPHKESEALSIEGAILDRLARWDEAIVVGKQAVAIARRMRNRLGVAHGGHNLSDFLFAAGRYADAWHQAGAAVDTARDLGLARVEITAELTAARIGAWCGWTDAAREHVARTDAAIAESAVIRLRLFHNAASILVAANDERWDHALTHARTGREDAGDDGPKTWRCRLAFMEGRARWMLGQVDEAREAFAEAWELGREDTSEVSWSVLAGTYLAGLDPSVRADAEARRDACADKLEVHAELERTWAEATLWTDLPEARRLENLQRARETLERIAAPMTKDAQHALWTGCWLHRRIAEAIKGSSRQ